MKLLTAQQRIEQYGKLRTRVRWKEWARSKTKGEITEKWLTRAVKFGEANTAGHADSEAAPLYGRLATRHFSP